MKRILIFNDSLATGGTEIILVDMLNYLAKEGHAVTLLLPKESDENLLLESLSPTITVKYLQNKNEGSFAQKWDEVLMIFAPSIYRRLKNVKALDYDVAICFKDSFYSRIFSNIGIPTVLWIHNIMYERSYEVRSFKEKIAVWLNKKQLSRTEKGYKRFDKVICVSTACRDMYIKIVYGDKAVKQSVEVLHNALDLSKIIELAKEPIDDIPQGRVNFVLVTRMSAEKRIDRLISSAKRLADEEYDFHVYLIGDGTNNEDFKKELALLGLSKKISLMGRMKNPQPYVLQSNWALCVSERESFSLTLLEAMALNTPVITTDCGGPSDIVDGGKYGILVENSTEGVYTGMKKVLDDTSLSVKYSSELDVALARFNYEGWQKRVGGILELH